jgi:ParB family chromosome partitioning protein
MNELITITASIDIKKIKVESRIRKDYGDIEGLAESIKKHGLLQPIVVTPDYILIAGERRLKAVTLLGWKVVLAKIQTATDREEQLLCEIAENEQRKEFTPSERVAYGLELEQIERLKAKERQATSTGGNVPQLRDRGHKAEHGRATDIVAKRVGFGSGKTYERAKAVVESGKQDLIEAMDKGEIGIKGAYNKATGKEEKKVEEMPDKQITKEEGGQKNNASEPETLNKSLPISIQHIKLLVNNFLAEADKFLYMTEYIPQLSNGEKALISSEIDQVNEWYIKFKKAMA